MKKVSAILLYIFISAFVFFELPATAANSPAAPVAKKVQTKHRIEFSARDKFILVGDLYLAEPKSNKPLVIALHSFSLNASVWQEIAQKLRSKGYNVLAMDIRGHGRSVYNEKLKLKSRFKFTQDDWKKLPLDVIDSIKYVRNNYPYINCDDIIMLGADIGASAQLISGAAMKNQPQKFVLISPMLNFKGLYIPVRTISTYRTTKFLVLLSKSDTILFNFNTETPPEIITYPLGGAGNHLIKSNPGAVDDIVNFIITK